MIGISIWAPSGSCFKNLTTLIKSHKREFYIFRVFSPSLFFSLNLSLSVYFISLQVFHLGSMRVCFIHYSYYFNSFRRQFDVEQLEHFIPSLCVCLYHVLNACLFFNLLIALVCCAKECIEMLFLNTSCAFTSAYTCVWVSVLNEKTGYNMQTNILRFKLNLSCNNICCSLSDGVIFSRGENVFFLNEIQWLNVSYEYAKLLF